ncbi:MAG: glycosyltransferase family 4 protein, partial [Vicinamibacteria bacterium]
SWKDRLTRPCPDVGVVDRRVPVRLLNLAWHRAEWPPVEWLAGPVDIAHSPTPLLMPARAARRVVTIHDLYFLDQPEATTAEVRRDYAALVRAHAGTADLVVTSSQHMATEVAARLDVAPARIVVCPGGAPAWTPRPGVPADGPVVFIGTLEPRKNVPRLLDVWERLIRGGGRVPTLVLAGGPGTDADEVTARIARAPLADHVRYDGYLPDDRREAFYKQARLLVVPSLDEGFGLPVVEACAAGVPVVAARRGALPEVGGDAPVYLDPLDAEAWACTIRELLASPDRLEDMRRRGIERARAFSWTRTAERLWTAYRGLAGRRAA